MTETISKPYHHGDLRQALLTEAERILENEGIQALTLRAVARAAGVSHTAPKNHFDDLSGLLTELAADGYQRLAVALAKGIEEGGSDPRKMIRSMGRAYLAFVKEHPGLFTLMFRSERHDPRLFIEGRLRNALATAGVDKPEALFDAIMDSLTFRGAD